MIRTGRGSELPQLHSRSRLLAALKFAVMLALSAAMPGSRQFLADAGLADRATVQHDPSRRPLPAMVWVGRCEGFTACG